MCSLGLSTKLCVVYKRKNNFKISLVSSQKVGNAKENSRMHPKWQEYPQLGKRHKGSQSIPQWVKGIKNIPWQNKNP